MRPRRLETVAYMGTVEFLFMHVCMYYTVNIRLNVVTCHVYCVSSEIHTSQCCWTDFSLSWSLWSQKL